MASPAAGRGVIRDHRGEPVAGYADYQPVTQIWGQPSGSTTAPIPSALQHCVSPAMKEHRLCRRAL